MAVLSWQSASAAGGFVSGTVIQGLAYINDPTTTQSAFTTQWQGTLLAIANVIIVAVSNIWGAKLLPYAQNFLMLLHVVGFISVIAVLWASGRHVSASEVFGSEGFLNLGGWSSMGLSLMVGQVSAFYALISSDAAAHLSEEVEDAGLTVPNSMMWSFWINSSMGLIFLISFLFAMPNVQAALASPTEYAFFYVFTQAISTTGVNGLASIGIILLVGGNISINASTARQTFAFARDNGLPFSTWLSKVSIPQLNLHHHP
jgi:amino acid transporter